MDVLSIGNSFSQDAQRYVKDIAKADGVELNVFNLYVPNCTLGMHFRNMHSDQRCYQLQVNGYSTGFSVSLKEALLNRSWDVVTLQQASHRSWDLSSYQPYLQELAAYVRRLVPKAKLVMHQTWAYAKDLPRLQTLGFDTPSAMLEKVVAAYGQAANAIGAQGILPCGLVLEELLKSGVESVHRDGYHASRGLGRYALGLTWYAVLTGRSVLENSFCDLDEPASPQQLGLAKTCVERIVTQYSVL